MRCDSTYLYRVPGARPSELRCEKTCGHSYQHQCVRVTWTDEQEDDR